MEKGKHPSQHDGIAFDDATAQCRFATISLSLHRHAMIGFEICYGLIAVKHGNQLSNRFETIS